MQIAQMQPTKPLRRPKCGFFRVQSLPSPSIAVVEVEIINKKKTNESFKIVLNCPTLQIIDEPQMSHTVKPGEKKEIIYKIIVSKSEIHRTPEVLKHKCVLTKWSEKSNTLAMCHFHVSVWPYGLFDYPCDDYKEGQLTFQRKPDINNVAIFNLQDSTTKLGLFSLYMVNVTCLPRLPLIEHIESINRLRKEVPWNIEAPANCSHLVRQNYVGTCHLHVFNLCHTHLVLVANTTFQLYDGETDECEYLKERLGDLAQHPLAAFFGLNYVETGYLVVVVLTQLLVILLTAGAMHVKMRLDRKTE